MPEVARSPERTSGAPVVPRSRLGKGRIAAKENAALCGVFVGLAGGDQSITLQIKLIVITTATASSIQISMSGIVRSKDDNNDERYNNCQHGSFSGQMNAAHKAPSAAPRIKARMGSGTRTVRLQRVSMGDMVNSPVGEHGRTG